MWNKYRKTGQLPKALENQPDVPDHLVDVWQLFDYVSRRQRTVGMSVNPIDVQTWITFIRMWTTAPQVRDDYLHICLTLDAEFVSFHRQQEKERREQERRERENAQPTRSN